MNLVALMQRGPGAAVVVCLLITGLVEAQTPSAPAPASAPLAGTAVAASLGPGLRRELVKLRDLGASGPIELRGVDASSAYLPMSVRLDEAVVSARLNLIWNWSPALLPGLSQLKVMVNDEALGTLVSSKPVPGTPQRVEIELDSRFFTEYARLRLQFLGHYSNECEFPFHSSLWASVSNESTLELVKRPLVLRDDLALLPAPFFDARDARRLELPFVLAGQPSTAVLHSAGLLASWFGALAAYRGADFPVLQDTLPVRHAVVLATNDERPAGLALPAVELPTLRVMPHAADPAVKLLVVAGRDAAQLRTAVQALVLGKAVLSGPDAQVREVRLPPPRAAYDAPNFVPTGRVLRLGELVTDPAALQVRGHVLAPIRVNLRLPPDVFAWEARGMPLELRYRYTPTRDAAATLSVFVNEQYVQSFPLGSEGAGGGGERPMLPFLEGGTALKTSTLTVPAFQLGGDNQLQFHFDIPPANEGQCQSTVSGASQAAIDPDSTLDLRHVEHYVAMPNLAAFANGGFPFTKYADLSQTALVLPDAPTAAEVRAMLVLLGRMGAATGLPALRYELLPASRAAEARDRDLLVVASGAAPEPLRSWGGTLPARLEAGVRAVSPLGQLTDAAAEWFSGTPPRSAPREGLAQISAGGPLAALMGFESPLNAGRSVVALNASEAPALAEAAVLLLDPGRVSRVRGDLVLIRGAEVEPFRVGRIYHVGELRWWRWVWFQLHMHPLLLALLGAALGAAVSLVVYRGLQRLARRRLEQRE